MTAITTVIESEKERKKKGKHEAFEKEYHPLELFTDDLLWDLMIWKWYDDYITHPEKRYGSKMPIV